MLLHFNTGNMKPAQLTQRNSCLNTCFDFFFSAFTFCVLMQCTNPLRGSYCCLSECFLENRIYLNQTSSLTIKWEDTVMTRREQPCLLFDHKTALPKSNQQVSVVSLSSIFLHNMGCPDNEGFKMIMEPQHPTLSLFSFSSLNKETYKITVMSQWLNSTSKTYAEVLWQKYFFLDTIIGTSVKIETHLKCKALWWGRWKKKEG